MRPMNLLHLHRGVALLQLFVGVGALAGGGSLLAAPDGHLLSMPVDVLRGTPFESFLVPGLLLFGVVGLGNLAAAALAIHRHALSPLAAVVAGGALMLWIATQVAILGGIHWLHVLYFALGLAIAAGGLALKRYTPDPTLVSLADAAVVRNRA